MYKTKKIVRKTAPENSILRFLTVSSEAVCAESIIRPIINDIIQTAVKIVEEKSREGPRKHDGTKVQKSTFTDWKTRFPWLEITDESKLKCSFCVEGKLKNFDPCGSVFFFKQIPKPYCTTTFTV